MGSAASGKTHNTTSTHKACYSFFIDISQKNQPILSTYTFLRAETENFRINETHEKTQKIFDYWMKSFDVVVDGKKIEKPITRALHEYISHLGTEAK